MQYNATSKIVSLDTCERAKCTERNKSSKDVDDSPKIQRLSKVQTKSEKIDEAFQRINSFQSKTIYI